jgi:hypothetical protein
VKKKDRRLAEIAKWRNHATENEYAWIRYIWAWCDSNILQPLRSLELSRTLFADLCKSHDIFTTVTSGLEELSENDIREREERFKSWIDPSSGKRHIETPEPVGPFLDDHGVLRNDPGLSETSRRRIVEILPTVVKLWEESLLRKRKKIVAKRKELSFDEFLEPDLLDEREEGLDAFLNHPRLKQCPVCKKWFAVSKTDQRFCQTPASDRPINRRTGKPRPQCCIVAYQRTQEYKEKTRTKMANWRAPKKAKRNNIGQQLAK